MNITKRLQFIFKSTGRVWRLELERTKLRQRLMVIVRVSPSTTCLLWKSRFKPQIHRRNSPKAKYAEAQWAKYKRMRSQECTVGAASANTATRCKLTLVDIHTMRLLFSPFVVPFFITPLNWRINRLINYNINIKLSYLVFRINIDMTYYENVEELDQHP